MKLILGWMLAAGLALAQSADVIALTAQETTKLAQLRAQQDSTAKAALVASAALDEEVARVKKAHGAADAIGAVGDVCCPIGTNVCIGAGLHTYANVISNKAFSSACNAWTLSKDLKYLVKP